MQIDLFLTFTCRYSLCYCYITYFVYQCYHTHRINLSVLRMSYD